MFNYGPATLYLPYWLSSLSGGRLSIEQAYPIILSLFTSGGFFSIFIILRCLELPETKRKIVLALLLISWGCFSMGLQYAPLRFVIVPVSLVLLDAVVRHQKYGGGLTLIKAVASSVLAAVFFFAVSPEMGVAGTVAVAAYGFTLLLRKSYGIGASCALGALIAAVVVLRVFPDYLLSVFAFASGGSNFPIYPDLHNITLVSLALFILPALIAPALANPFEKRAPIAVGLGVAGGMLLPAAFGRADPGHVFYNGLIPIIMMFPAAMTLGAAWFRRWAFWYASLFVIALQFSYWSHYYGQYMNAIRMHGFYRQNPEMVSSWKAGWDRLKETNPNGKYLHWSKPQPFPEELLQYASKGPMLLTSGNEGNYWLARFLSLQGPLSPDYFHAYSQGATTPEHINKRVIQSNAYDFLITPESVYGPLAGPINLDAYSQGVSAFLSKLLLFPVNSQAIRPPYFPDTEYSARMMDRFDPVAKFNGYLILQKKKPSH